MRTVVAPVAAGDPLAHAWDDAGASGRGRDGGVEPRNFLQPCLLLLLLERPDHGYSLLERLKPLGIEDANPGRTYRALRDLERAGETESRWQESPTGPARRVYLLTPKGLRALEECTRTLEQTHRTIGEYLRRHSRVTAARRARPGTGPTTAPRSA